MSANFDIAGMNLKEWAFIVLMINLTIVMVMVSISFAIAVNQGQDISITGNFDLSQFTGIMIGIATVATVLVAQQLNTKNNAAMVAAAVAATRTTP